MRPQPVPMQSALPQGPLYAQIFRARLPAIRKVLIAVGQALAAADPDLAGRAELVLAELLNNLQRHGAGTASDRPVRIVLHLSLHRDGVQGMLIDDGRAIPPGYLLRANPPEPADLPESGFGWSLIHLLATDLHYWRALPCNILRFRVPA